MKTKELYNAPEMESILLPSEAVMLNDSSYGEDGKAGQNMTYNSYDEDF